jgi:hypothetical protein
MKAESDACDLDGRKCRSAEQSRCHANSILIGSDVSMDVSVTHRSHTSLPPNAEQRPRKGLDKLNVLWLTSFIMYDIVDTYTHHGKRVVAHPCPLTGI